MTNSNSSSYLQYSIVIATRNRLSALELSIPLMLAQTRRPAQIIVIDSSEDHAPVAAYVKSIASTETGVDISVVNSAKGLTHQRNVGLEHVKHPIVFFPDDDSIWFRETAELQMKVYERDMENAISAVCAAESSFPPPEFPLETAVYQMNRKDKLKLKYGSIIRKIQNKLFPDPAFVLGRSFIEKANLPDWVDGKNIVPVEWMTGFRMSFRTEFIKRYGFDTAFTDYSLFEDIDASFSMWHQGIVIGVNSAKVYHYKSPEKRGSGVKLGATQILNKAYVIAKHSSIEHRSRKVFKKFAQFKIFQYRLGGNDDFGKQRFRTAKIASKNAMALINSTSSDAVQSYRESLKKTLHSQ